MRYHLSDYRSARELFERALESCGDAKAETEEEKKAEVHLNLANCLAKLDEPLAARKHYRTAVDIADRVYGKDSRKSIGALSAFLTVLSKTNHGRCRECEISV